MLDIAVSLARLFNLNRNGNVAIIFALSSPLVVGGAAFGVETGLWYLDQVKLQQMADTAAYAAAVDNRAGKSVDALQASAQSAATDNGFRLASDTLVLHTPPTSGSFQNTYSSEVLLTRTEQRYFTQVFDTTPAIVKARAVATYVNAANACIIALDPSISQSVYFSGSSTIALNGCNVMSDSISSASIYSQGATTVSVPCLMTAGDVSLHATVNETACGSPMTQLAPVADPFRNVPEPANTGNCQNGNGNTLQPGRYCGGLSINNSVTFKPGTYIIDGGTFKANGNAVLNGSGVTFVLVNNATLSFNGNATLNLSPPTSGAYSGMLFFGSRSNSASTSITLNGNAASVMTGAIYFPRQTVSYIGNFQGANGCTQLVARTIQWSGNSNLGIDCSAYGMNTLPVGGVVKIVE
ncbi:MAG TPA: pilus assembly protein TadG-related protein [Asticcacaulis sp.]|nr:pilus assembly protein TadG-related protein [Asticcacaulis sp.]